MFKSWRLKSVLSKLLKGEIIMEINVENFVDECNRINKEKEEMKKLIMELVKDYTYYPIICIDNFFILDGKLVIEKWADDGATETLGIPLDYILDKLKEKSNE